jgi:hypothetical protein
MTKQRRAELEARVIADRRRKAEPPPFTRVLNARAPWAQHGPAPRPRVDKTPVDAYPKARKVAA